MAPSPPERLRTIRRFEDLISYLEEELDWPLGEHAFEDLTFEYEPSELGLKDETIAEGTKIRQLRPLKTGQPWGIFFVEFPKKRLPVLVLRRILQNLVIKKRASAQKSTVAAWDAKDLLFISAFGDEAGGEREIAFGHFHEENGDKPVLRVLDWDGSDTPLKLARLDDTLRRKLTWPQPDETTDAWRERWSSAFRLRLNHVIKTSDRMADVLAGFARGIRQKVLAGLAAETDRGPLHVLLEEFRKSLLHDLSDADFADTYAQTVTYGLLSLAITRTQAGQPKTVTAGHLVSDVPLTSPFLKEILGELLKRGGRKGGLDYDELGLHEVVEFLNSDETDLPAILADFGNKTAADDPVIHFYEHFLTAYDKKLKVQRGVFYTPRPVVTYIVRSVHEVLQKEFGLIDGLADTATWGWMAERHPGLAIPNGIQKTDRFVTILDPATGTATFLVEVIDVIYRTLLKKWQSEGHGKTRCADLWNAYVPEHLLPRLYGYELLMAPYAIAHLKIGLKLAETGYTFSAAAIARVFLTNALEPPDERKLADLGLMALAREAEAVTDVKRKVPFTVVVGNPPYSTISLNRGTWIRTLVDGYSQLADGRMEERGNRNHLQDDYVKFYRFAHEMTAPSGVMGLITNSSYLRGPWFRGMRYQLSQSYAEINILDLHGAQAHSLDGDAPDQNVFEITTAVAIAILRTPPDGTRLRKVSYSELVGTRDAKSRALSSNTITSLASQQLSPAPANQWRFVPHDGSGQEEWEHWTVLPDLFHSWGAGVLTNRNGLAVDTDRTTLLAKVSRFADLSVSDATVEEEYGFSSNYQWNTGRARRAFSQSKRTNDLVEPYLFRPFDFQWIYWHSNVVYNMRGDKMEVFRRSQPPIALMFSRNTRHAYYSNVYVTRRVADRDCLEKANVAPLYALSTGGLLGHDRPSNLSGRAADAARQAGLRLIDRERGDLEQTCGTEDLLFVVYALLHSPQYRQQYGAQLRIDFPRLPPISDRRLFLELAALGGRLVALHLMEAQRGGTQEGVTTAYIGSRGAEISRPGWSSDTVWIDAPPAGRGQPPRDGSAGFQGVPEAVWNFHLGGYQVCEKWLKDRKGRRLSTPEIDHYQKIVGALAETIRLMKQIDEVIESHGGWPGAFQTADQQAGASEAVPLIRRAKQPRPEERYVTFLPLVSLKAAAGAFGDPQHVDENDFEWMAVNARHRLRRGMFIAQVVGKSMEPAIPDGSFCLFSAPVEGTRQGKTVLVQLRDKKDPETGERYTVKRYESEKVPDEESWRHARISLKPTNPDFAAIELDGGEGDLTVIAEFIEVLGIPRAADRD